MNRAPRSTYCVRLAPLLGFLSVAGAARAEDGGNDLCPAVAVEADDVRERYDSQGRLVHQLRLRQSRVVEEVAILHDDDHAVARTEVTPGQRRIARTHWDGDRVERAECWVDGRRTGLATYHYDGDVLVAIEKRVLVAAAPPSGAASPTNGPGTWRTETTRFVYDADGQLLTTEVRGADGKVLLRTQADRAPPTVPVTLALTAGGTYQSDTELYDVTAGLGIHRRPRSHRYGADSLEVGLEALFKFHRADNVTTTDQTTVRFAADYHEILPRITLFTFTSTDRNVPANLRLNLEEAVLGVKLDLSPEDPYQLDVSFAPVWNFRSIVAPQDASESFDENTSKLRGSLRARAGIRAETWSVVDTFEFLPTLFGENLSEEDGFWNRTVIRNTLSLDVTLTKHLTFREQFQYTRDPALRAQAECPDDSNPLCRGYSFSSTTALVLNVDL